MALSWTVVKGAVPIHLGNDPVVRLVCRIDDDHVLGVDAPEAHLVGGIALGGPVPAFGHAVQDPLLLQIVEQLFQILTAESFPFFEG